MLLGILADTHDRWKLTRVAVTLLRDEGAEVLVHCGDLSTPKILNECALLPCYFTFGNHDADNVPYLRKAASKTGAICLEWGGEFTIAGKRVAVTHGHMRSDVQALLAAKPDFLLFGHTHQFEDRMEGETRRINPGALHRAELPTVALLDPATGVLRALSISD